MAAFLNSLFIFFFLPESLTQKAEKLIIKEGLINIRAIVAGLRGEFGVLFFLLFAWAFAISNFQVALPLFSEEKFAFTGEKVAFIFTSISSVGGSFLRPTINAILSKETKEGQGTTMGLAFSFESLGRIAGPLIAGVLIALLGTKPQFIL